MKSSGKPYALPLCVYTMKNHSVVSYSCRHGVIYRKTVIFVVNAVNSSDLTELVPRTFSKFPRS